MAELHLSIVIPCLNEAKTLASVIGEAKEGIARLGLRGEIIVSDNGSTDGSQKIAEAAGARVVNAPIRGYGAALHYGILGARGKWVIYGDADMSYDFSSIGVFRDFIAELTPDHVKDLVLGSRLAGNIESGAMPLLNRYLGTPALNLAIRIFFALSTSDCNSGMRLVRRDFYLKLPMRAPGMEWASEFLIKAHVFGARYSEVPILYRKDQRGRRPHLRRWRDGWRHLKTIVLLSPNRLIMVPSLSIGAMAIYFSAAGRMDLTQFCIVPATTGFGLGLLVKLVLYADGVRASPVMRWLVLKPTAEWMLGGGALLTLFGILAHFSRFSAPLGMTLLAVGTTSMLTSFAWGVLITHTLGLLQSAPEAAEAQSDDKTKAA